MSLEKKLITSGNTNFINRHLELLTMIQQRKLHRNIYLFIDGSPESIVELENNYYNVEKYNPNKSYPTNIQQEDGFICVPFLVLTPYYKEYFVCYKIYLTPEQKNELKSYCTCDLHKMSCFNPIKYITSSKYYGCINSDFPNQTIIRSAISLRSKRIL